METISLSTENSLYDFRFFAEMALRSGKAVSIDLQTAKGYQFTYLRDLYRKGIVDRTADEWVGVLTFMPRNIQSL